MNPSTKNNLPEREEFIRVIKTEASDHKWKDDPFVSDAIEGFQLSTGSLKSLNRLDKRFISHKWFVISTVIVIVLIIGITLLIGQSKENKLKKSLSVSTLELNKKEDRHQPKRSYDQYEHNQPFVKERPINQKIFVPAISPMPQTNQIEKLELLDLPTQTLAITQENVLNFKRTKTGKELYLYDLKTVDYRVYRSVPKASESKPLLTGTPASENIGILETNETDSITYIDFITGSMKEINKGNYRKAHLQLEQILKTYPSDINALFYSGICFFQLQDFSKALMFFTQAEKGEFDNFEEEAEWYRLKCFQQIGDTNNAEILLKKIRERNGYYSKQLD